MIVFAPKAPGAVQKYAFDFTPDLNGATITGTPTITPTGVVKVSQNVSGNLVQMVLSGGTAGTVAKVEISLVTSSGETLYALGVVPIGGEVISLDEAKASQRITDTEEDALLGFYLRAAISSVEIASGRNLTQKVQTQVFDGFPGSGIIRGGYRSLIQFFRGPVSSVLEIAYDDGNGIEQTLADYRLIGGTVPQLAPKLGAAWPVTYSGSGTVRISYIAGYAPEDVPAELIQAALLLFGHFNANREAVIAGDRAVAAEVPLGVQALIDPYRLIVGS
jgi:uncharacterized phiE125 gp8 family phage protein